MMGGGANEALKPLRSGPASPSKALGPSQRLRLLVKFLYSVLGLTDDPFWAIEQTRNCHMAFFQPSGPTILPEFPKACRNDFCCAGGDAQADGQKVHFHHCQNKIAAKHEKNPTHVKWELGHPSFEPSLVTP